MTRIPDMTDDELKAEFQALHHAIYIVDCYGTNDVRMLMAVTDELTERGYEQKAIEHIEWVKDDEGDMDVLEV